MQRLPSKVLDEIFDAIDGCPHKTSKHGRKCSSLESKHRRKCSSLESKPNLSKLSDNEAAFLAASSVSGEEIPSTIPECSKEELAITLFPGCRDWLEKPHRYDHTPEMYISVHFNRTNDLERQYGMIRYMELRPTKDYKDIVEAWYRDLRTKRTHSFDDKPILPGVPDYPVFSSSI